MPIQADHAGLILHAGQIVLADWRSDEPDGSSRRRLGVVVEDDGMFSPLYPNAIIVPLTSDDGLIIPDLAVAIEPTEENGCVKPCWAVSHLVATMAKHRLRPTRSRITSEQITSIRRQIALAVGVD